jgi:hypothetical protein
MQKGGASPPFLFALTLGGLEVEMLSLGERVGALSRIS